MKQSKDKVNITVLVSGGGTNLQSVIDHIENGYIDKGRIVQIISSSKSAYALERGKKHGIPGVCIDRERWPDSRERGRAILQALQEKQTELIILAGYMSILDPELIEAYRGRIINIHPSLIPKYCGKGFYGKRVHRAILENGERESGATVHFVDEGVDTGKVILQEKVPVEQDDTEDTLAARVLTVEHRILPKAVKMFCDGEL